MTDKSTRIQRIKGEIGLEQFVEWQQEARELMANNTIQISPMEYEHQYIVSKYRALRAKNRRYMSL